MEPKKALICITLYSSELHVQIGTQIYTKQNAEVQRNPKLRGGKTMKSAVESLLFTVCSQQFLHPCQRQLERDAEQSKTCSNRNFLIFRINLLKLNVFNGGSNLLVGEQGLAALSRTVPCKPYPRQRVAAPRLRRAPRMSAEVRRVSTEHSGRLESNVSPWPRLNVFKTPAQPTWKCYRWLM